MAPVMHSLPSALISDLNSVAAGSKKASIILVNCNLLSVYTGEELPDTQVAIHGDRIAYVGPDASHAAGSTTKIIDAGGAYVGPGLADPHIHIDQFVAPAEFAKRALLRGVTSLFSDPIDITGVAGYRGFCEFQRLGDGLPVRIFQTVPGGLPVDPKFSGGGGMSTAQQRSAVGLDGVVGIGEVFAWTKVTSRDPATMRLLKDALDAGCVINGHTAGMSGKKLNTYVSSGILSCHEPIDAEQALERLRLGMWVMIREGSIRRDLEGILRGVLSRKILRDRLMFCSDGVDPLDMARYGHIDHCMREAVRLGLGPAEAAAMSSRNAFEYYGMGRDLGGVAPGKLADIVIFDGSLGADTVIAGGRVAVYGKKLVARFEKSQPAPWLKKTVRLGRLLPGDFAARSKKSSVSANTIVLRTELVTGLGSAELGVRGGQVQAGNTCKVAAFDRVGRSGKSTVGFLENFGADCSVASTWCFHEGDMMVVGTDDSDMAAAANHVIRGQGGIAVVRSGRVMASMPLQLAGIMSAKPFEEVAADFERVGAALADAGCQFPRPHLIPLFLPFLALPSARILSGGMVDVKRRTRIRPYV